VPTSFFSSQLLTSSREILASPPSALHEHSKLQGKGGEIFFFFTFCFYREQPGAPPPLCLWGGSGGKEIFKYSFCFLVRHFVFFFIEGGGGGRGGKSCGFAYRTGCGKNHLCFFFFFFLFVFFFLLPSPSFS